MEIFRRLKRQHYRSLEGLVQPPPNLIRSPAIPNARIGRGIANVFGHHGEILQGCFRNQDGDLTRALVTLPCPVLTTRATFYPSDVGPLWAEAQGRTSKSITAAHLTARHLGLPDAAGRLILSSIIPAGSGMGSSSADVIATIKAVSDGLGHPLDAGTVARLAVNAEGATDSIMYDVDDVVLFAHREGFVLERFAQPLPVFQVIGIDTDPNGQVDTMRTAPARYRDRQIDRFEELRERLRSAIAESDHAEIGAVATASAEINQSFLPKPGYERLLGLLIELGAVGLSVAHSGTVASILIPPDSRADTERIDRVRAAGFTINSIFNVGRVQ